MNQTPWQQAQSHQAHFYYQFGGQGVAWFKEVQRYYNDSRFQKFFSTVFEALDEERHRVEGSVGLPEGINLKKWLECKDENKAELPSDAYLSCASVSMPLIQITQFAHLENLLQSGVSMPEILSFGVGATGHSQGIIGATFLALGLEGEAYYKAMKKFIKLQLYLGVSAQKVYTELYPNQKDKEDSTALGANEPSPMVAVLGSEHKKIEMLVEECNALLPQDKKIYVSLYNTPVNRILSAHRSSLIFFHKKCQNLIQEKEIKYVYLSTSAPFHCKLMEPIRPIFENELKHIDFTYTGKDLKFPVYSFYDQVNYQSIDTALGMRMCEDLMIHPLYWSKAMEKILNDKRVTHIVDFGPGKTSQRLSSDTLKMEYNTEKEILTLFKDLKPLMG